jgi:hypothetical protein
VHAYMYIPISLDLEHALACSLECDGGRTGRTGRLQFDHALEELCLLSICPWVIENIVVMR